MTILWQWNGTNLSQILTASAFPAGVDILPSGSMSASIQPGNFYSLGASFLRFRCAELKTNTNASSESMWVIPLNLGVSLPKRYRINLSIPTIFKVSGTNTGFKPYILHCTQSLVSASFSGRGFGHYFENDATTRMMISITGTVSSSLVPGGKGIVNAGSQNPLVSPQTFLEIEYHTGETPFARVHSPFWIRHTAKNTAFADAAKLSSLLYFTGVYNSSLNGIAWD